jgi:hypothetical protein
MRSADEALYRAESSGAQHISDSRHRPGKLRAIRLGGVLSERCRSLRAGAAVEASGPERNYARPATRSARQRASSSPCCVLRDPGTARGTRFDTIAAGARRLHPPAGRVGLEHDRRRWRDRRRHLPQSQDRRRAHRLFRRRADRMERSARCSR